MIHFLLNTFVSCVYAVVIFCCPNTLLIVLIWVLLLHSKATSLSHNQCIQKGCHHQFDCCMFWVPSFVVLHVHAYTHSSLFLSSSVMQCSPKYNVVECNVVECRLFEYWACLFFCASFDFHMISLLSLCQQKLTRLFLLISGTWHTKTNPMLWSHIY